jgi:REP element-mobilizing transposase RayT
VPASATLKGFDWFDYSSDGGYFVTICTHRRQTLLTGECFRVANEELDALSRRFPGVTLHCGNILPDHVHAIFILNGCAATLSAIMQAYKSITTREIRKRIVIERVVTGSLSTTVGTVLWNHHS